MALGLELLVHLRAKAVHQHDLHAHALDQCEVLRDQRQLARRDRLTGNAHHQRVAAVLVDIGRDRAEPGHEGEVEDVGHGQRSGQTLDRARIIAGCLILTEVPP